MKYTRVIQTWLNARGRTDHHSMTVKMSKLEVLKEMTKQGEIPSEVVFDLRMWGESHFIDQLSGERTAIYVYEFDTSIEGQPQ